MCRVRTDLRSNPHLLTQAAQQAQASGLEPIKSPSGVFVSLLRAQSVQGLHWEG